MPIFEYICKDCGKAFEAVVLGSRAAACPSCKGTNLEQQLSRFAVSAPSSSATAPCGAPSGSCGGGKCGFN
ncbi:MAG TPA: zinc ribbon domain-containing protein [Clostridia bacterium]|nr:zinc ribbon domain-containing protein [Clostridia bacterium]